MNKNKKSSTLLSMKSEIWLYIILKKWGLS